MPEPRRTAPRYWLIALVLLACTGAVVWAGWFAPFAKLPRDVPVRVVPPR